jgi:hypothetical protein
MFSSVALPPVVVVLRPALRALVPPASARLDLLLFNKGRHFELAKCLGAQSLTVDGISGV